MFRQWFPKGSVRAVVAGNTFSQLVGRVFSSVSVVIMSLIIANRYGPDGYGDFVKITTYVGFFYLFADFGLNAVYLQHAGTRESRSDDTWQNLFGLRMLVSLLLVICSLSLLTVLPNGLSQGYTPLVRYGILALAPIIVAQALTTTTNAYFQKILRYDLATYAQNAGSLATLMLVIVLSSRFSSGAMLGVAGVFIGSVVTAIFAIRMVRQRIASVAPRIGFQSWKIFKEGIPLGLALVFNLIYFHADSVILTLTRSTKDVGIYGLAYKVFELSLTIPIFFMNSVYPLLLKEEGSGNGNASGRVFKLSFLVLLSSSVLIALAGWVCSPLVTLVRPDFADSIVPLRILLLGLPVFFVSALFMWYAIAKKRQHVLVVIHGIAMVVNIAANMMLVPTFGYLASAWITIGSELVILLATAWIVLDPASKKGGLWK